MIACLRKLRGALACRDLNRSVAQRQAARRVRHHSWFKSSSVLFFVLGTLLARVFCTSSSNCDFSRWELQMFGLKSACVHAVVLSAMVGGGAISAGRSRRCHPLWRATAVDRPAGARRDQAAAGLRPLGRAGQQGGRHLRRRQEVQGRDRLRRLSVQHAARGADHRADDHPGQRQLPVRRVRFRRREGCEHGLGEIQGADDRRRGVIVAGLRPGLQIPVRYLHAERHADNAADADHQDQGAGREEGRDSGAQRSVPAGDRAGDGEVGQGQRHGGRSISRNMQSARSTTRRRCRRSSRSRRNGSSSPATSTTCC